MVTHAHRAADDDTGEASWGAGDSGQQRQGLTADAVRPVPNGIESLQDLFPCGAPRTVTVVICAYTERRWDSLLSAIASLRAQRRLPDQLLVVIDHNDRLLEQARSTFSSDVEVRASVSQRGLSGARNTGIRLASGDVVAFLDDDAEADPGWLEELLGHYGPDVAGAGGIAVPVWPERDRPRWFPREFDWVVGCSYVGLPVTVAPQRNLIGAAMSFRRSVFDVVGSFDTAIGRVGSAPLGCEETEFAIRLRRILVGAQLLYVPHAIVHHHVARERAKVPYFLRRCYAEGISKAVVAERAGPEQALSSERRYVCSTLPLGVLDGLRSCLRGDPWAVARSAMICVGFLATLIGYLVGKRAAPTR
jgi:glucosyl-dolichyl phosphate glucuronosyltransferase